MRTFHSLVIDDEPSVGAARRGVNGFAGEIGLDSRERAELDIVVQEIGTNAVRYANQSNLVPATMSAPILHWASLGGDMFAANAIETARFHSHPSTERCGIELFYTDRGPGIHDLNRALHDNVSFGGSLGGGLGAIRRLTDEFYIYSTVRRTERLTLSGVRRSTHGTAILCRKWAKARPTACDDAAMHTDKDTKDNKALLSVGAWSRPRAGETFNGDVYFLRTIGDQTLLAVVDGLGHGAGAHAAAEVAVAALDAWTDEPLNELMYAVHDALRATRGAVMSAAIINQSQNEMRFAGVGNIHTRVFDAPLPAHPISVNGTLGTRLPRIPVSIHKWDENTKMVMASDGLSASWDISAYPGLFDQPAQMIAGLLMRDYERLSDDATVLVVR